MAAFALTNAFIYIAGHDFTGDSNQVQGDTSVDVKDSTTFGSTWQSLTPGLKSVSFNASGFFQAGANQVDPSVWAALGSADLVHTVGLDSTETSPCYMFQAGHVSYSLLGQHGELAPFTVSSTGTNAAGAVRGQLAKEKGTVSAIGALGAGVELGAVGASEYLYGTFHVFDTPGTTITVVLESDDNSGFTSATTRATFGPITAAGGTWATRTAGAITDTFFRLRVTAITGTFTVAGAIGIG